MILPARIKAHDNGLFEFSPEGELAAVARVHDSEGDLADFVAWFLDRPGEWWLRYGDIPILGSHALAVAAYHGDGTRLYATPEAWLLGGRRGVCVLLWGAPLNDLFAGVGNIECDNPALGKRIMTALRRWEPRVKLMRPEARHGP